MNIINQIKLLLDRRLFLKIYFMHLKGGDASKDAAIYNAIRDFDCIKGKPYARQLVQKDKPKE